MRGEGGRTEAGDGREERQDYDPVVAPPDDPAAVDEDEVPEEVAEGDEDVRADKLLRFVCVAVCARIALRRSFSTPQLQTERSDVRGW